MTVSVLSVVGTFLNFTDLWLRGIGTVNVYGSRVKIRLIHGGDKVNLGPAVVGVVWVSYEGSADVHGLKSERTVPVGHAEGACLFLKRTSSVYEVAALVDLT